MAARLGRWMQIIALWVLPISIVLQLSNVLGRQLNVSQMVYMLVFGVILFYAGRLIEGYGQRPSG
ncbi:MAG: hypothetical protein U0795_10205 [Pirellulales bacterium]